MLRRIRYGIRSVRGKYAFQLTLVGIFILGLIVLGTILLSWWVGSK